MREARGDLQRTVAEIARPLVKVPGSSKESLEKALCHSDRRPEEDLEGIDRRAVRKSSSSSASCNN